MTRENWRICREIAKGWSGDRKFFVETFLGEKYLLRISPAEEREQRRRDFALVRRLEALNLDELPKAVEFGEENGEVYQLLSWMEGETAEELLCDMDEGASYRLGVRAGEVLRAIHSFPAEDGAEDWERRFNRKIDNKLAKYRECGLKLPQEEKILGFIERNRHLLKGRPQCLQHGDYHTGNMVLSGERLGIIDFNRADCGDPWEEFNRIVWCVDASPAFASGQIDGYFDGDPPEEFFRLMALYIACNQVSSLYWAIPFGEQEIATMRAQAEKMLEYYSGMESFLPSWYRKR